jgi:hypothetical protein
VDLRDPATRQPLFRVRSTPRSTTEPDKAEMEINAAVTAMFEKYPARTGRSAESFVCHVGKPGR